MISELTVYIYKPFSFFLPLQLYNLTNNWFRKDEAKLLTLINSIPETFRKSLPKSQERV